MNLSSLRKGFTLIELLIVVAIIAILAAIAVPNFLEAQTRAKVSRTLTDMRSMIVGLESYAVDNNRYPETDLGVVEAAAGYKGPLRLTTPISYLTSIFQSPWKEEYGGDKIADELTSYLYVRSAGSGQTNDTNVSGKKVTQTWIDDRSQYLIGPALMAPTARAAITESGSWLLKSVGPNNVDDRDASNPLAVTPAAIYDPTNGTVSGGDIVIFSDKPGSLK